MQSKNLEILLLLWCYCIFFRFVLLFLPLTLHCFFSMQHPVYCVNVVGTQNAHNLISISTDGKMCSWSLDMLSQPQVPTMPFKYTIIVSEFEYHTQRKRLAYSTSKNSECCVQILLTWISWHQKRYKRPTEEHNLFHAAQPWVSKNICQTTVSDVNDW